MFYPPNVAEIAGPGLVVSDKRRIMERKRQEKSYLELARRVLLRNDASENPCQYTAVRCSGRVFPVTVDRTTDVFDLASFVVHQMGIGKSVEDGRVTPHLEFNGKPLDNYSLKVLPLCRDSRGFF
uniref:Uncharacterized protein n=1 Tax=Lotharella globosa TaxID=91324 RepID=A0A7S3ZHB4_9EUKA